MNFLIRLKFLTKNWLLAFFNSNKIDKEYPIISSIPDYEDNNQILIFGLTNLFSVLHHFVEFPVEILSIKNILPVEI